MERPPSRDPSPTPPSGRDSGALRKREGVNDPVSANDPHDGAAPVRATEALLRQIRELDPSSAKDALGELVARHYRYIEQVIRARRSPLVKAEFDTADCAQNVALEVFQYLPGIDVDSPDGFRRLLRKMIDNTLRDMYARLTAQRRKGNRQHASLGDVDAQVDVADSSSDTPIDSAGREEHQTLVRLALLLMSPEDQELIVRLRFHHENPNTVGDSMNLTRDAVRMRCARAEVRLSAKLQEVLRGNADDLLKAMADQMKRLSTDPGPPPAAAAAAEM
jgi:RNA polymerase sigma factor (sigma-70 family)